MSYTFIPDRMYRMPVHFGPSLGPRQGPDGGRFDWSEFECDSVVAHYRSDRAPIEKILPPRFECYGDPIVSIGLTYNRNIPWLAGRGYNTLGMRCPVQFNGKNGPFIGSLLLVLWENMADPITTGREELGFSKVYCDLPPPRRTQTSITCEASWEGFRFFELELSDLQPTTEPLVDPAPDTGGEIMHYRYLPRTGEWGKAEVEQVTTGNQRPKPGVGSVLAAATGKPRIQYNLPRWEDMPTQCQIIEGLNSLTRDEILNGYFVSTKGHNVDLHHQRIVE
ncbi:acetoacetate decarboxylase family protein [Devosia sp. A369]